MQLLNNHKERGELRGSADVAAVRALGFYLLLLALGLGLAPVRAQQGLTGNVRGGFVVPDYDPQTNRKRSVLYGDSAKVLSISLLRVSKLKIEVYNDQEKVEWIVESPDCLYDNSARNAHSSSNLVVRAADGQFTISGEGFEWQPTNQCLVISNRVRTEIRKPEKGQGTAAANTNAAAFARQNLELTAQRLNFNAKQRLAEYLGGVFVREIVTEPNPATPPYQIQCGTLQVQLPQGGRGLESITAVENVRIEQGSSRAQGEHAVYLATNEVVELTGQARWQTDSAEGHGDRLLMERKENRFQTLGHAYAKLKEPAKDPGAASVAKSAKLSRELEISAGRLIANLPPKGTNVFHLEAEEAVELIQGDTHAYGNSARYDGSVTNGALQLSGQARWESPEIQGKADQLMVDREARRLKGEGNGWLRLQQTQRLNVATNLPAVEIVCDRYELDNGEFQFVNRVKAKSPEWQLACERLLVKTSGASNRLESLTAENGVVVEPSLAGGKGEQGWRLTCEKMFAAMKADGRSLQSILATNAVHIEPAGANKQRWVLDCGRMTLGMAAGAGNLMERIIAEQQVTAKQLDTNGTSAVWQMQSPQMEALLTPTNQLHQVTAQGGVVLEQNAKNLKGGAAIMRSQNVLLVMGASNQVDQITAEGGVDLEQGLSRGRGERAVFSGKDDRVELHGHPWLTYVEPENKATNRPPRQLRVEGADTLVWYRSSNRFQGKGSYRFVPAGVQVKEMQLPGLTKKKTASEVPVGPAGPTKPISMSTPETQTQPVLQTPAPGVPVANGSQPNLLATDKLVKAYKQRRVVDGVSIFVRPGEVVGLLGPNGAGKTTTFNMVVGVVRPDAGAVNFLGADITSLPMHKRARRGIGYLTQEPSVFRKLTVEQNILAILETLKISGQERRGRLKYLLDELDLTPLARSYAYQLSGGEKRRLEITRALVTSPKLLLLDEPFAGIDPIAVYEVQKIVRRLKDRGLGILITDHSVRETLKLVDRAYLIHKGQVVCEGDAEFLVNDPKAREIYLGPEFNL